MRSVCNHHSKILQHHRIITRSHTHLYDVCDPFVIITRKSYNIIASSSCTPAAGGTMRHSPASRSRCTGTGGTHAAVTLATGENERLTEIIEVIPGRLLSVSLIGQNLFITPDTLDTIVLMSDNDARTTLSTLVVASPDQTSRPIALSQSMDHTMVMCRLRFQNTNTSNLFQATMQHRPTLLLSCFSRCPTTRATSVEVASLHWPLPHSLPESIPVRVWYGTCMVRPQTTTHRRRPM